MFIFKDWCLSSTGFTFPYHGDLLTFVFPKWRKKSEDGCKMKFFSKKLEAHVKDLPEYWRKVGAYEQACRVSRKSNKIYGFSLDELIKAWATNQHLPSGIYVILWDVDLYMKPTEFWDMVPQDTIEKLKSDVVIFSCESLYQAERICKSVSPDFATAYVFDHGEMVMRNSEP